MKERDKIVFFNTTKQIETTGIRQRCNSEYILSQLNKRFPDESIQITSVNINDTSNYKNKSQGALARKLFGGNIKGLPSLCEVRITRRTVDYAESIIVWSPLAWNDRFMGTAGGGYGTGGEGYIVAPKNTARGQNLAFAVMNGFTAATTDAGCGKRNWAIDSETGKRQDELIENWRARSTHFMTLIGKAVAEILHSRPVLFSYLHGGSGGGRQSMAEVQEFPNDYNGVWASCPAIHWTRFVLCGLWPIAVMNCHNHILTHKKIKFFTEAAQNSVGGKEKYYTLNDKVEFDPFSAVGQKTKGGIISDKDAAVMQDIWNGPHRKNGERLWYGFRPGVVFWNVGIPIGAFYYTLFKKQPKPFFLSTHYARWITQNPKQTFENITKEEFEVLFDKSVAQFPNAGIDNPDITAFKDAGGKLIIDHGIDDPLIPVDGTIDYYNKVCKIMESKTNVDEFIKLYITPGDGHGSCSHHGPGITEADGMTALINWVEQDRIPGNIRVVQVNRAGETVRERTQSPY